MVPATVNSSSIFLQLRMPVLSNAGSVLCLLTTERPELSVTDVSRLLGMPKSPASRLLKSMREEGLLPHVGATPRHRVGHVFFQISWLYGCNSTLVYLADREVVEICRATRHGADVLVLRIFLGPDNVAGQPPAGVHQAYGRTLRAVRALLPKPLVPPSANAPQDMRDLLQRLDEVRRVGRWEARDEGVAGVGSVAPSFVPSYRPAARSTRCSRTCRAPRRSRTRVHWRANALRTRARTLPRSS